jgi:hypothetical protein
MAGRVPWERYEGDDIEAVVAIMLLRDFPHGQRIRPAKGDGGVDVLIPHEDGQWEVYQVKGFTTSLDSSQKRQITKSWNRLIKFTSERDISLKAWHVVRPLDPTHPDRKWLRELTDGADFPCDWVGLSTVDGWAAKYPDVIDYYLLGGQQRVLDQVRTFLAAASLDQAIQSGSVVEPARAIDGLIDLHDALNASDPHYRYEIHVEQAPRAGEFTLPPVVPGLVFSTTLARNGTAARIDVIARYNEATKDRPIPVNVVLRPDTEEQRSALADFMRYGTAVDRIPADVLESDLPGGFSSESKTRATASFLPALNDLKTEQFDLVVLDRDGGEVAKAIMNMASPTSGVDGTGAWSWEGKDPSGVLEFGIRHSPASEQVSLSSQCNDITGLKPADCLPALQTLASMQAGVTVEVRFKDGPPLLKVDDIPGGLADSDDIKFKADVCADLVELQKHIPAIVRVPNPRDITMLDRREWAEAAALLRDGLAWSTWESLGVRTNQSAQMELPARIRAAKILTVRILNRKWELGPVDQEVIAGRRDPLSNDDFTDRLYPTDETRLKLTIPTDEQEARQRARTGLVQVASGISSLAEIASTVRPERSSWRISSLGGRSHRLYWNSDPVNARSASSSAMGQGKVLTRSRPVPGAWGSNAP